MKIRGITEEQKKKLDEAQRLLTEVHIEMSREEDKLQKDERSGNWKLLYRIRCDFRRAMWSLWSD